MTRVGGIVVDAEFLKTASIVVGLCLSIYQGISFVSATLSDFKAVQNQVGRIEVHMSKIDDKLEEVTKDGWTNRDNLEEIKEIKAALRKVEDKVLEMFNKSKDK